MVSAATRPPRITPAAIPSSVALTPRERPRLASTRLLVFEVGDGQADHVADALASLGYADITITPDLAEEDRVVEGRR